MTDTGWPWTAAARKRTHAEHARAGAERDGHCTGGWRARTRAITRRAGAWTLGLVRITGAWPDYCNAPGPHYPPLNRLPHSESPPFSFKSIHHLPSFTKAPNMCIFFAEVFVGGIRGASATVSLSLLPRLACPHSSPTPTDTLRRNTSRAQRCRRAKPGYTWSPRKKQMNGAAAAEITRACRPGGQIISPVPVSQFSP